MKDSSEMKDDMKHGVDKVKETAHNTTEKVKETYEHGKEKVVDTTHKVEDKLHIPHK